MSEGFGMFAEPWWVLPLAAGLFGLAVGSFLNVCAFRWPRNESVVSPGSHCPGCDKPIRWYDNVPVLSWLLLRGRCRSCAQRISIQYPLVELATALVWAGMFARFGPSFEALRGSLFLTILFGIALADARFYIIPDELSLGGLALGLLMAPLAGGITALESVVGAGVGFALLWLVARLGTWAFRKEAMGGGDIKMMAMVGAFLGMPRTLLTIFLGALLGSVVFGPIAMKTKKLVPFGIFLAAGAALAYAWGDAMITWYVVSILGMPAP